MGKDRELSLGRRAFLKGMGVGMGAMGLAAGTAFADTAAPAEPAQTGGIQTTLGQTALSLQEINRRRHEIVDAAGDYEMSDGTVVPAAWNKLRLLINTYGYGDPAGECSFDLLKHCFNDDEDLAQAWTEMPYGVAFTPLDFAETSGRSLEECQQICETLSTSFYLARFERAGVPYYRHEAFAWGAAEYQTVAFHYDLDLVALQGLEDPTAAITCQEQCGSALVYAIPCSQEVLDADSEVLVGEDWKAVVASNTSIAVTPCSCRIRQLTDAEAPSADELKELKAPCGHAVETCMYFGEEADYTVHLGVGRRITQDEALEILQHSVDEGMILQSMHTSKHDGICSCHGDCCAMIGLYYAMGEDRWAACDAHLSATRHELVYDKDACIQCGACVDWCPMSAISMDEDGYPTINAFCMACGQCCTVCPKGARKLRAKDADQRVPLPLDRMDDHNMKAGYRMEHGTL